MNKKKDLPRSLQSFEDVFEKTRKKFVKITSEVNEQIEIWQSKFSGRPFLPPNTDYPKDSKGNPLYLLAQINFEEVPSVDDRMPKKGILQFYIPDDVLFGMESFERAKQHDFRILYFSEIDKNNFQKDLPQLPVPEYSPFKNPSQEQKLIFSIEEEYPKRDDFTLVKALGDRLKAFEEAIDDDAEDWFFDYIKNDGHKLGGYPAYNIQDPRYDEETFNNYDMLLLQIDSENGICWSDLGVAHFFISSEKLKKRDFTDVLYEWGSS